MTATDELDDVFGTVKGDGRTNKIELLPDGEYTFAIKSAEYKSTSAGPLVTIEIEVVSDGPTAGSEVQKQYWLKKKGDNGSLVINERNVAELQKDLKTLGFDPENWNALHGRPLRTEFNRAAKLMPGLMFKGKKKANESGGKTYHNLYVNKRSEEDGKAAVFTKEMIDDINNDPFGGS